MRVLGWSLFAATCVGFALQGLLLAASTFSMTSFEVLVDHVFPLLGIGAVVGAGVGALIVSRYPRNLVGWLFLIGQLGNVIGLAADAFGMLVVQGVVDSLLSGQIAGYLSQVFGTVFTVNVMSVIFMIAPDGRLLSRRWRDAVGPLRRRRSGGSGCSQRLTMSTCRAKSPKAVFDKRWPQC